MKLKLFTHNDLDGVANVILAKQLIEYGIYDELDYETCNYKDINERVLKYLETPEDNTDLIITDISVNEEVAEILDKTNIKKQLFDHHATALNLNKYSWCKVETIRKDSVSIDNPDGFKISATNIFFNTIVQPQLILKWNREQAFTITEFVFLVDEYDTWAWESNETIEAKRLNDLLYIKGIEKFIENITEKINEGLELFDENDNTLLDRKQMLIDYYILKKEKEMITIDIENLKAGVVYAEEYISELASQILKINKDLDIMIVINGNQISFRTRKDNVNVAKLAQKYGGGGHFKASGCTFTDEMKKRAFNSIFNV